MARILVSSSRVWLLTQLLLCGCSFSSRAVKPPGINASAAATAAIAQYDQDNDQALSKSEIEKSALTLESWDLDKNGSLSQEEIEQRLEQYLGRGTGMITMQCFVFLGNRPLEGARVTFEPEEFLGGAVHPAFGTTAQDGGAALSVAEEFRPEPSVEAVEIGLYKVRITHPEIELRPEYNTDTTLTYDLNPLVEHPAPRFRVRR